MARRVRQAGVYFVTSNTLERRCVFTNHECGRILLEQLIGCREKGFYKLHAFVVMPNHFHALLTPSAETTIEKAMMMIKGGSAYRLKEGNLYHWPVWQAGFHDHWVRDENDYRTKLAYIGSNPVDAHLAESASRYPLSSILWKIRCGPKRL
ncbi:MAG TPA: transposase [Candidatus Eremiobacteraceae bacterium]|nr:transposase [Candidatus Eremiobacteraceae bacterium]